MTSLPPKWINFLFPWGVWSSICSSHIAIFWKENNCSGFWIFYALTIDGNLLWKFKTGNIVMVPCYHDDKIYVPSEDENVYAIDAESGREIWRFETGGILIQRKFRVQDNRIFIGSWNGNVYALDLEGRKIWTSRIGLGQQANFTPDKPEAEKIEFMWESDRPKEKQQSSSDRKQEARGGYGSFSSNYLGGTRDYAGRDNSFDTLSITYSNKKKRYG